MGLIPALTGCAEQRLEIARTEQRMCFAVADGAAAGGGIKKALSRWHHSVWLQSKAGWPVRSPNDVVIYGKFHHGCRPAITMQTSGEPTVQPNLRQVARFH